MVWRTRFFKEEYLKFLEMKKSNDEDVGQKKKKIIKKKK